MKRFSRVYGLFIRNLPWKLRIRDEKTDSEVGKIKNLFFSATTLEN